MLVGGYRCVFDRKCPFTLWVTDEALVEKVGHHIMQAEELRVKILIKVSLALVLDLCMNIIFTRDMRKDLKS